MAYQLVPQLQVNGCKGGAQPLRNYRERNQRNHRATIKNRRATMRNYPATMQFGRAQLPQPSPIEGRWWLRPQPSLAGPSFKTAEKAVSARKQMPRKSAPRPELISAGNPISKFGTPRVFGGYGIEINFENVSRKIAHPSKAIRCQTSSTRLTRLPRHAATWPAPVYASATESGFRRMRLPSGML
jgi:hypothetical protein